MQELLLTSETLTAFAHLIPQEYTLQLGSGDLAGTGVVDDDGTPAAVFLCQEEDQMMRIVWLYVDPDHRDEGYGSSLLERRLDAVREAAALEGVFADLPENDPEGLLEELFLRADFTLTQVDSAIYTATLGDLKRIDNLHRTPPQEAILPLGKAGQGQRRDAVLAVRKSTHPVPLPRPLDWDHFDPALSALFLRGGQVRGLLLFSRDEGFLSMDCAWTADWDVLPYLLAYAAQTAWAALPLETEVVIPAVNSVSAKLAQKLLGKSPRRVTRAVLWFQPPSAGERYDLTLEELRELDPYAPLIPLDHFDQADLTQMKGGATR